MRASARSNCLFGGWLLGALFFGGCAPAASQPPRSPEAAPSAPAAEEPKAAAAKPPSLPPSPSAVPAWAASCERFVKEAASAPAECSANALAKALSSDNAEARDTALSSLESCTTWPAGVVRALRAELAPTECGDAVVGKLLDEPSASALQGEMRQTLVALALAARLRRLASEPPAPPTAHDKAALQDYFKNTLFPWISEQALAIRDISKSGADMHGYAQGIVAIEAGMADMRFVEIARNVPIPSEMEGDAELRNAYYGSLDEALEPRKERGRDAALVGLGQLAQVGLLHSPRLDAARTLLSHVYGAHRIDALDRLMLPPLPPLPKTETPEVELARKSPTFYAPFVLPPSASNEPAQDEKTLFRAFLEQGVPVARERALAASAPDEATTQLLAQARLELGRTYFRAEDFAQAQRKLAGQKSEDAAFLHALATALLAGPKDAADLIRRGPRFADALGNLEELDGIAASKSRWSGAAGFNAAYLRELVAPTGDAAYWQDLGARYGKAARSLSGAERKEAEARAKAALDTARALKH